MQRQLAELQLGPFVAVGSGDADRALIHPPSLPGEAFVITSERTVAAPTHVVHSLLTDVGAWPLWSPHIARVEPPRGSVAAGWEGRVKARFAPAPTTMRVTWAEPGRGMGWETPGLGHTLRYEQRIAPVAGGSQV